MLGGKQVTDNEIEDILTKSKDSKILKEAYLASKEVGKLVAKDVIALVKKRNAIAKELGFKNYHDMSLRLSEQDPEEIESLFNELDSLIKGVFIKEKSNMDDILAKEYKIKKEELMPWHYQNRFFQEAPKIYNLDLDTYYKDKNIEQITASYYKSIGLPIDDILKKSDLYERKGKYQHAYCIDIEKVKDVRVVCNIKPNFSWMGTMLHEFGHASYDKYIDLNLPWDLQSAAHIFTTEAIAMMFGRLASNAQWMQDMLKISDKEKNKIKENGFKSLRLQQLVFSRWAQVMFRFEKSMYENPDQDLNKLWWDLVEKYQMIKKPEGRNEPDWASKIHIASSPCYYHNYQLGELLASQLNHYITFNILKAKDVNNQSFANRKEVGEYLKTKVFAPGMRYRWDIMIEKATGEKLTPKYYAEQFVN
jgi:peptidyl-dipeptidase A